MRLLNILGLQKKSPDKMYENEKQTSENAVSSTAKQHFNEKMHANTIATKPSQALPTRVETKSEVNTVDMNNLNWRDIPGYEDWVKTEAQKLVEHYLLTTGADAQLMVYPGGIIYVDPLGRYFFPSMFFRSEYYSEVQKAGFILDLSRYQSMMQVREYISNNVRRRDNLQFINFDPEEYRIGDRVKNPMSKLFT